MKKGRAQAALEFLMTYGWAILFVIIFIGALGYYGVLDANLFLPEKCLLETGFDCTDLILNSYTQTVLLDLTNARGNEVVISGITLTGTNLDCEIDTDTFPFSMEHGEDQGVLIEPGRSATLTIPCETMTHTNTKREAAISISWKERGPGQNLHTARGDVLSKMEELTWPTEYMCDNVYSTIPAENLCDEYDILFPAQGNFEGFSTECCSNYDLCCVP